MVHKGPSTGCWKCRERRVKCDGERPACRTCVSRGHVCPGFQAVGRIVFKDQTRQVRDKQARRARAAELAITKAKISAQMQWLEPQTASICFFHQQYVLPASRDPSPTTAFFEHVLPLFASSTPSSALGLAVTVMTARIMCLHYGQEPVSPWHLKNELAAAQAIRAAISDPVEMLRDETLLAVLCVGFTRFLAERIVVGSFSRTHLVGALALVRYRGATSFASTVSQSLLAATRSYTLLQSLWFPDDVESQDLVLLLPDVEPRDSNPAATIHYILAQVLRLQRRMVTSHIQNGDSEHVGWREHSMATQAHRLCEALVEWRQSLPLEWDIFALPQRPMATPYLPFPNGQASAEVAFVVGQWHCTYLLALKLAFATTRLEGVDGETSTSAMLQCIIRCAQHTTESLLFSVLPFLENAATECFSWTELSEEAPQPRDCHARKSYVGKETPLDGRQYLSNLLNWAFISITEQMYGADEFCIQSDTMELLSSWYQTAVQG